MNKWKDRDCSSYSHNYARKVCIVLEIDDKVFEYYEAFMCSHCHSFKVMRQLEIGNFDLPIYQFKKVGRKVIFVG